MADWTVLAGAVIGVALLAPVCHWVEDRFGVPATFLFAFVLLALVLGLIYKLRVFAGLREA